MHFIFVTDLVKSCLSVKEQKKGDIVLHRLSYIAYNTSLKSKPITEFNQKYIIRLPVSGIKQISQVIEIIHVTAVIPVVSGLIPYKIDRGTR
jgi:hypothetical protein